MANAYLERDNRQRWRLEQNGQTVQEGAVQRVVVRFPASASAGDDAIVLDTDEPDSVLSLEENATVVEANLGHVKGLTPGLYRCWLTVYDAEHPNGIAWAQVWVRVQSWPSVEK